MTPRAEGLLVFPHWAIPRCKARFHYLAYSCELQSVLYPFHIMRVLVEFCLVLLKGTTYIAFSSSIEYSKQPIWSSIIGFGAYVLPYLTTSIPSATLVSDGFRASFVFRAYLLDVVYYLQFDFMADTFSEQTLRNSSII